MQRADDVRLRLSPDPSEVRVARDSVEGLAEAVYPAVLETVRLVISELVTNAIRHGDLGPREDIELRVSLTANAVRVEVTDDGRGFRPSPRPTPRGTSGYGLFLVEQLAERWGVTADGRTRVWAEVGLEPAPATI